MKLTSALVPVFSFILFLQGSHGSGCRCTATNELTRAGANEMIVVTETEKYSQLAGVVRDMNGELVSDVLVEVYDA